MCDHIASVTNYSISNTFGVSDDLGFFTYNLNNIPTDVDEVIIRQLDYQDDGNNRLVYHVYSNLAIGGDGTIGTIWAQLNYNSSPGTRIRVHSPIPNQLTFHIKNADPQINTVLTAGCTIVIHLEMIRYVKR